MPQGFSGTVKDVQDTVKKNFIYSSWWKKDHTYAQERPAVRETNIL